MKRSVILMGGKTFVLSLPSQWVKKYRIQKGEELDLEERENTVIISVDRQAAYDELEISFKDLNVMLGRAVGGLYKAGYNKVKVYFETPNQLKIIEDTLQRTCVGFEITKQDKNYVIIESLTEVKSEEFDNSLKRLFYSLEMMNEELCTGLKEGDKEILRRVVEKDSQINRLADFCRRVINSGETNHIDKPTVLYYVVEQLERIGDIYKKIARESLDKNLVNSLKDVNEFLISYRKMFYDFNTIDYEAFGVKFKELESKIKDINLRFLLESIFDMNGALVTLNL